MGESLDETCEFILSNIASKRNGKYSELYTYFVLPNGESLSDNNIDPKRVVSQFEKYGLSKPLFEEKCELTKLGIEVGKGIGFIKHKENEDKKNSNKEKIDKRKNANINHTYFITRPKNIIGIILIILIFIGLGTYKDIKEYLKSDKENAINQKPKHNQKEEKQLGDIKTKNQQEYNSNTTESKTDSLENELKP